MHIQGKGDKKQQKHNARIERLMETGICYCDGFVVPETPGDVVPNS